MLSVMPPDDPAQDANEFALPRKKDKVVQPLSDLSAADNAAANIIRNKIAALYKSEPSASAGIKEASSVKHRSKHQQYMYELSRSGKPLAEIQSAWHAYYAGLPDEEKHQVWREFYDNYNSLGTVVPTQQATTSTVVEIPEHTKRQEPTLEKQDRRTIADIKKQLLTNLGARAAAKPKKRSSLFFGLSVGSVAAVIMMFGFFNERFIAPFITPSRVVSSAPIILDASAPVGPEPKLIIPKINLDVPVVYDETSTDEKAVQRALEDGVLHYATTTNPGELGNTVIFGHSSNNILNRGKYKFAFVLLNRLQNGDTFMLHYEGKRYVYRVTETKIVPPTDVSVLSPTAKPATVTLITCDPPGTAINRLVVVGEQISPDPAANIASNVNQVNLNQPEVLPSNAPSLWSRFTNWLSS
jgi:LPXTG-site transpeptidase (sortase) family protein